MKVRTFTGYANMRPASGAFDGRLVAFEQEKLRFDVVIRCDWTHEPTPASRLQQRLRERRDWVRQQDASIAVSPIQDSGNEGAKYGPNTKPRVPATKRATKAPPPIWTDVREPRRAVGASGRKVR
jgi:hypothetical protein